MTKTSAEIEAEVEASRTDLDRNVEALKQKMTPGQLFDEAARIMGGTGKQVGAKFVEQAQANPMPLAVMGLGLAWLMSTSGKSHSGGSAYGETRSFATNGSSLPGEHGGRLKEAAHDLGDRAHDVVSDVKDKLTGVGASAADGARSAREGLNSAAASARDMAGESVHRVQRTFFDTLENEPLLLAGLGVIVGAAIGAALPSTHAENRLLGEQRDKLVGKGKELAQTGLEKAADAAQATYGAVKSELQNTDGDREPAERLADAARSGVQAAQEQLQGPAH